MQCRLPVRAEQLDASRARAAAPFDRRQCFTRRVPKAWQPCAVTMLADVALLCFTALARDDRQMRCSRTHPQAEVPSFTAHDRFFDISALGLGAQANMARTQCSAAALPMHAEIVTAEAPRRASLQRSSLDFRSAACKHLGGHSCKRLRLSNFAHRLHSKAQACTVCGRGCSHLRSCKA